VAVASCKGVFKSTYMSRRYEDTKNQVRRLEANINTSRLPNIEIQKYQLLEGNAHRGARPVCFHCSETFQGIVNEFHA